MFLVPRVQASRRGASFDRHVKLAQKALEGSSTTELVDAADELATVEESERAAKVADFMSLCDDLGYEPPEG